MTTEGQSFEGWLEAAGVSQRRLSQQQIGILQGAFWFLQEFGADFASQRIVAHFLLHCHSDLKIAQIGRLVGLSRQVISRQRNLSSKQVVQEVHHRFSGRPYGKLLPRYAGPIAEFLITHPKASRYDLLDFIERTWQTRVSRPALSRFLKKYGLDDASRIEAVSGGSGPLPEAAASSEDSASDGAGGSPVSGKGTTRAVQTGGLAEKAEASHGEGTVWLQSCSGQIVVHDPLGTSPWMLTPPRKNFCPERLCGQFPAAAGGDELAGDRRGLLTG